MLFEHFIHASIKFWSKPKTTSFSLIFLLSISTYFHFIYSVSKAPEFTCFYPYGMDVGLLTGSMGSMWFRPHAWRKCIQLPLCLYDRPMMPGLHCCIVVFGYFWLFLLTSTRYLSHGKRQYNANVPFKIKSSLVFSICWPVVSSWNSHYPLWKRSTSNECWCANPRT